MTHRQLSIALLAAALLGAACGDDDEGADATASVNPPEGVATFDVASRNHVAGAVDYPQTPPVGGDHNGAWWNCGAYDQPIIAEAGVHSLEHGAVWITYDPDLAPGDVDPLRAFGAEPYVLLSPWEDSDLPAPIVASAWGAQLELDAADDPALEQFLTAYRQAPTSPEPGAPCTGGVDFTNVG